MKGHTDKNIIGAFNLPNYGPVEVCIFREEMGTEDKPAHFHLMDGNKNLCGICLTKAEYFKEFDDEIILTKEQAKALSDFMGSPVQPQVEYTFVQK